MTWPEVVNEALGLLAVLGMIALFAVLVNGWPKFGRRCDCHRDHEDD